MAPRRRSSACLPIAFVAGVGLLCCLGALLAMEVSVASLGTPARNLPWADRTFLAVYLVLNQRSLSSPAGTTDQTVTIEVDRCDASAVAAALGTGLRIHPSSRATSAIVVSTLRSKPGAMTSADR
jgi:hypothetical protein